MRRALLLLCLLAPLPACSTEANVVGVQEYADDCPELAPPFDKLDPPIPSGCPSAVTVGCVRGPGESFRAPISLEECVRRSQAANLEAAKDSLCPNGAFYGGDPLPPGFPTPSAADCASYTPSPAPGELPPEPTDTLASASALLRDSGGEVTLIKGLSPSQALAMMVPTASARPYDEVCDGDGVPLDAEVAPDPDRVYTSVSGCLAARVVSGWTLVWGSNNLTVGLGKPDLLAKLSLGGREVIHVADHFEADAPFVVARDGKEVRRFDFCSEGSADEGAALPEEQGLVVDSCDFERFQLVERLTGIAVTADLLTTGDRVAVVTTF